ncbi:N-acetylgalactosamine kinase isoform X3 [Notamacropus eugenii]|uniref:N-acetylgalactosamine kinase isoform X3 n=1 Tax=Notamacropus eugenii TaxID=9315 RepID=UPI003B67F3F4
MDPGFFLGHCSCLPPAAAATWDQCWGDSAPSLPSWESPPTLTFGAFLVACGLRDLGLQGQGWALLCSASYQIDLFCWPSRLPLAGNLFHSCSVASAALEFVEGHFLQIELAEICTKSERYIGTEGGGMDQSISFLGEEGKAKLIEFNPLRATDVQLPSEASFVIANSCVAMNKAATSHFNTRVMECRLAAKFLAKYKGLQWNKALCLEEVQIKLGLSLEEMLLLVEEVFHSEPYSQEEVCNYLDISLEKLKTQILCKNTQDVLLFKLYQRAKHVFSEAARVLQFKKICEEAPANAIQLLGDLMNQSHVSCKNLYECSCPELDRLVDVCRQFGAQGSRLTGAGWGGCAVSLVPTDKLPDLLANVQETYYQSSQGRSAVEKRCLFATRPGGGALVFLEA